MNATPKPIRCWAVYNAIGEYVTIYDNESPVIRNIRESQCGFTIIPGRFVPDKPKKRKGK